MLDLACKDIVFHFNKKHLEDPDIPMWIVKTAGKSYYVNHVECSVSWSTKETPDNSHTKGSIKIKNCLLVIDDDNTARISELTIFDRIRLRNQKKNITRIIFSNTKISDSLKTMNIRHSTIKKFYGSCGETFYICDILDAESFSFLGLQYPSGYRIMMPNENYYRAYDDPNYLESLQDQEDEY